MAETIKAGYYIPDTNDGVWYVPESGYSDAKWCNLDGTTDEAYFQHDGRWSATHGVRRITYAEARAILGDKWPASWPQSEGVAESTAAPATGQAGAGALSGTPSDSFATKALTEGVT